MEEDGQEVLHQFCSLLGDYNQDPLEQYINVYICFRSCIGDRLPRHRIPCDLIVPHRARQAPSALSFASKIMVCSLRFYVLDQHMRLLLLPPFLTNMYLDTF
jgi:hypothetical protein